MLESYILSKLEPLKDEPIILLRDPQRMIQRGARAVDGWAEENGFTVLFCSGNLALRERLRSIGSNAGTRLLLVDLTREDGRLFYPDLEVKTSENARLKVTLRDFLVHQTGDHSWPHLLDDRNLTRLLIPRIECTLNTYQYLRQINETRFTDSDLYKIVIGSVLEINPFRKLTPSDIRRICLSKHEDLEELNNLLTEEHQQYIQRLIMSAPEPFCWLLDRDPESILRAFTLAAILHQHELDYSLLLSNIDPALYQYRNISRTVLEDSMRDQVSVDPDQVLADVKLVEDYLQEDNTRLTFLLSEQLRVDDIKAAEKVLVNERLSGLIRSLALASLLFDLVLTIRWKYHAQILKMLEAQEQEADFPVLRRPTDQWQQLMVAYRRAISIYQLTEKLKMEATSANVSDAEELTFEHFHQLWNVDKLNRLDYYLSDLDRILRVGEILPLASDRLWPQFLSRWDEARKKFKETSAAAEKVFHWINRNFQDLYQKNYTKWILQPDSPAVFTHQFLARMLKAYWDPRSGQKAVILVFDGLRTDAWDEFLRPVLEEKYDVVTSQPGSALIPTETELSRKAISAGRLPLDFPGKSRQELVLLKTWLKENMGIEPYFSVVCDDDTAASGMTVRYNSDQLDYVVFNFTDDNLHHNQQDLAFIYNNTVREIIRQDVRAVLRDLPSNALVFITSDHGFKPMPPKDQKSMMFIDDRVVTDYQLIKYSSVRASHKPPEEEMKKVVSFDIRQLRIPIPNQGGDPVQFVIFPRPGYFFMRERYGSGPDRYSHGGVSLAECMVPMVVMGPRTADSGILFLDEIIQSGTMAEDDPLLITIKVRARQIVTEPVTFTLSFSEQNLMDRKEIMTGVEKEIRVEWKKKSIDITESDRQKGYIEFPVTVTLGHRVREKQYRQSQTVDMRIRIDTDRLRRRIDSRLDLMMGKMPGEMKG